MRVVIAGGHGQIAMHLLRRLVERGDAPVGLVRNPDHVGDLERIGAQAQVLDLEQTDEALVADALAGADAAVFAAGAGPGSGAARKDTMDRAGAELFARAAVRAGVRRHVLISAMRATRDPGPDVEEVFAAYLRAKGAAEEAVQAMDLDWTILRPGMLTNNEATGLVELRSAVARGEVSRADVAAVIVALLDSPATAGMVLEVVGGQQPIKDAVAELFDTTRIEHPRSKRG
ncbi:NAD(P)H-binding protein [Pseudactinotalea sp. Z1739]|uniref:NAD(P)H-binding protein n=1 Tax=Pseudactinotalea sp. Z1739 TaxID=3413028 RepID=UPI003C7E902C